MSENWGGERERGSDPLPSAEPLDPPNHPSQLLGQHPKVISGIKRYFRNIRCSLRGPTVPSWEEEFSASRGTREFSALWGVLSSASRGGMRTRAVVPTESRAGASHLAPGCPDVFLAPAMLFHILFLRIHRKLHSHMEHIWDNNSCGIYNSLKSRNPTGLRGEFYTFSGFSYFCFPGSNWLEWPWSQNPGMGRADKLIIPVFCRRLDKGCIPNLSLLGL